MHDDRQCEDLKFGRTVHSLITALSRYEGIRFVLISPDELKIPDYIKEEILDKKQIPYTEVKSLDEAMPELDILYMTRVPEMTLCQRRGISAPERLLYPHAKAVGTRKTGYVYSAPTAARQRNFRCSG